MHDMFYVAIDNYNYEKMATKCSQSCSKSLINGLDILRPVIFVSLLFYFLYFVVTFYVFT